MTLATQPPSPRARSIDRWLLALGASAGLALALLWVLKLRDTAQDDFFISYTYARNLVEGAGFAFNPGERVFGLTNPGLALLLALAHLVTRFPVPWLGTAATAAGLLGACTLLVAAGVRRCRAPEAIGGGLLVLGSSAVWASHGAAWPWVLLLLLAAAALVERRPWAAGLLAGLAVWFRPDAALGAGLLGLLWWHRQRRWPWRYALVALGVVAAGLLLALVYFGSALPNTLVAKHAMGGADAEGWTGLRFWLRAGPMLRRHFGPPWPLLVLLGLAGLVPWWRRAATGGRLVIAYAGGLAVAYPLLGVPYFGWYAAPCLVTLLYGAVHGVGAVWRRAAEGLGGGVRGAALAAPLALALAVFPLYAYPRATTRWYAAYDGFGHLETYRRAALWMRDRLPETARIAYVEIGVLGYYSERPIQDLLGLVSPEVLPYVRRNDPVGAFLVRPTEIVLFHSRGRMRPIVTRRWFKACYRKVAYFQDPPRPRGAERGLTVYRRRAGCALPPPRPPRGAG